MNKEEIKVIVENPPSKEMATQKIKELCDFLSKMFSLRKRQS